MSISKELDGLMRRIRKISPQVNPPTLSMNIVSEGMELPEPSPWALTIYIESKKETLNH